MLEQETKEKITAVCAHETYLLMGTAIGKLVCIDLTNGQTLLNNKIHSSDIIFLDTIMEEGVLMILSVSLHGEIFLRNAQSKPVHSNTIPQQILAAKCLKLNKGKNK